VHEPDAVFKDSFLKSFFFHGHKFAAKISF